MSEASFWDTLRKGMRDKWIIQRHEDAFSEGIPDLSYDIPGMKGSGWIELKYLKSFPKRESTVVKIPHYSIMQRNWIKQHGRINNRVYLFVQVNREYFLFNWLTAAQSVGLALTKEEFYEGCFYWQRNVDFNELRDILFL